MELRVWLARNDPLDPQDASLMMFLSRPYWSAPVFVATEKRSFIGRMQCVRPLYLEPGECREFLLSEVMEREHGE